MPKRNLYSRSHLLMYYQKELEVCEDNLKNPNKRMYLDYPEFKGYTAGKADGIRFAITLLEAKV